MTPRPDTIPASIRTASAHRLRLALDTAATAPVNGFWWPYSRGLTAELPEALAMLTHQLGPIHRVIYHLDEWDAAPRDFEVCGRRVRLDGYRHMPARIVEIHGAEIGAQVTLRLITPVDDADLIDAQQRWESEGGAAA